MEAQVAYQCPLFKYYDFGIHMNGRGGGGILLIPKKKIYVPKHYGFGELALAPYLQEPFNEGEELEVSELKRILDSEGEILLGSELDFLEERKESFLHRVLNKFVVHDIVKINKVAGLELRIDPRDVLSAGQNYDRTRVYRIQEYSEDAGEFLFVPNLKFN